MTHHRRTLADERADIEVLKQYYNHVRIHTTAQLEPIWHLIGLERIKVKMERGMMYVIISAHGKRWVEGGFDEYCSTLGNGHGIATGANLNPAQRAPVNYNK